MLASIEAVAYTLRSFRARSYSDKPSSIAEQSKDVLSFESREVCEVELTKLLCISYNLGV